MLRKLTKPEAYTAEMTIARARGCMSTTTRCFELSSPNRRGWRSSRGRRSRRCRGLGVARDKWVAAVRKTIVVGFKTAGRAGSI